MFYHGSTHVGSIPDLLGQFYVDSCGLLGKTELKHNTDLRFSRRILEYYYKLVMAEEANTSSYVSELYSEDNQFEF
jgi:hypothetical protein